MTDTKDVAYVRERLCKATDFLDEIFVKTKEISEQNTKLKELLKRVKMVLEDEGDYMIVQEINQVLGE